MKIIMCDVCAQHGSDKWTVDTYTLILQGDSSADHRNIGEFDMCFDCRQGIMDKNTKGF